MRTWVSPFPVVARGTDEAKAFLKTIDEEIGYLDTLVNVLHTRRYAHQLSLSTVQGPTTTQARRS